MKSTLVTAVIGLALLFGPAVVSAQRTDRVRYNEQDLWLSGANIAWVDFARDIGPGTTRLAIFEEMFRDLHAAGGNSARLWLHTTGEVTPAFSGTLVVGPGAGAVQDLQAILDLAWENEISLMLCLWGHDMLRTDIGTALTERNRLLLEDVAHTTAYIENGLLPLVEGVKGHPAILAWEVFNEPEGISVEHGWSDRVKVPMSAIQRVTSLVAGAIHRADPTAMVTTGAHGMYANTDSPVLGKRPAVTTRWEDLDPSARIRIEASISSSRGSPVPEAVARSVYEQVHAAAGFNYYRDDRLVSLSGDPDGTLDFYTIHYYNWAGTAGSPFHHAFSELGLDKPMAIGEFFLDPTLGVAAEDLYRKLFDFGYAGAYGWQWYDWWQNRDGLTHNWPLMLQSMTRLFEEEREAVDLRVPGPAIYGFSVTPKQIEPGQSAQLSWEVRFADEVRLDGTPVDSVSVLTVSPVTTTTYLLSATGDGITETAEVTLEVLSPGEINRALDHPTVASSSEVGGDSEDPANATDGNLDSRWSSNWDNQALNWDDQWIDVDLGAAYDVSRVVLVWEAAYGRSYDLDVSYDGQVWTTVFAEDAGGGGTEVIDLSPARAARYVRMHGTDRATQWGFSLWEFEVYGRPSAAQPPTVTLTEPAADSRLQPLVPVVVRAEAADLDGAISNVVFVANGSPIGTASSTPYEISWTPDAVGGDVELVAIATDASGIEVRSAPVHVLVLGSALISRYEAEDGVLSGDVTTQTDASASNGQYVALGSDAGSIVWTVQTLEAGVHQFRFRVWLPSGRRSQSLRVSHIPRANSVPFDGPTATWIDVTHPLSLRLGANTVTLGKLDGDLWIDFVDVIPPGLITGSETSDDLPRSFGLSAPFPNPFRDRAVLPFEIPTAGPVRLEVFDTMGRRVASLVDAVLAAGAHEAAIEADNLASGTYLARLSSGTRWDSRVLVLVR